MRDKIKKLILQFIHFSFVGVTCFAIDYCLMVLLKEVGGIGYLVSSGISFTIATVINYFLSSKFVFDHRTKGRFDLIIFVLLGAGGLGINQILMWVLTEKAGIIYLVSKLISGILVSFYNFVTRKLFLERGKRHEVAS